MFFASRTSGNVDELQEFAKELFGDVAVVACGADTAVIARGTAISTSTSDPVQRYLAHATIRTTLGRELSIYSIRLQPPQIDMNILNAECWAAHNNDRVSRREQLQRAVDEYRELPEDQVVLFGGDFNVTAHDGSLGPLRTRLRDAFRTAGVGFGNTATNDLPLFRIDQLWHSPKLKPLLITAVKSSYSDHRIVVGVFGW